MAKTKLPGEYRRRSLVTVEMDGLDAALFAPVKLEQIKRTRPAALEESVVIEENYIVSTKRLDGRWSFTVEHDGVATILPPGVVDRIMAQRDSIITEERKDRGRLQARQRAAKEPTAERVMEETGNLEDDPDFRRLQAGRA